MLQSGMNAKDVASSVGVSLPTLYRHFPARDRLYTDGG
ncbi:TetR family transcriptional regulator [Escherichia coli]